MAQAAQREENLFVGRSKVHHPPLWKKHPTHQLKLIRFIQITGQTQEVTFFAADQREKYLKAQKELRAKNKSEDPEGQW